MGSHTVSSCSDAGMEEHRETLREIREQLQIQHDTEVEPGDWVDLQEDDSVFDKIQVYTSAVRQRVSNRFRRSKKAIKEIMPVTRHGDEMTQELEDAWNLYTRGGEQICSRDIGHVLRILGQNPTEDEIVGMVMKSNCEWDGFMTRSDFLTAGLDILKSSFDLTDDVRAAFKVFDNNNGNISREFSVMFAEADLNKDGRIDFEEFSAMMLPNQKRGQLVGKPP